MPARISREYSSHFGSVGLGISDVCLDPAGKLKSRCGLLICVCMYDARPEMVELEFLLVLTSKNELRKDYEGYFCTFSGNLER